MLISLPKDVLKYILSLVVFDFYLVHYGNGHGIVEIVERLSGRGGYFDCFYRVSAMSCGVKTLGLVHPLFREILMSVTKKGPTRTSWCFDARFFHSILDQNDASKSS